jgi:hypothetical protein
VQNEKLEKMEVFAVDKRKADESRKAGSQILEANARMTAMLPELPAPRQNPGMCLSSWLRS